MARPTKVDYKAIKLEYVTGEWSYRALAAKNGINFSTLAQRARAEDWPTAKKSYQASLAEKTYDKVAEKVSREESEIRTESILALRMGIRRFAQDVAANKVAISAGDAVKMIQALAQLTTEPEGNDGQSIPVIPVGPPDPEFLRRLIDAARGRVDRARVLDGTALPSTTEPRPN